MQYKLLQKQNQLKAECNIKLIPIEKKLIL